jgi:hypothetical protein
MRCALPLLAVLPRAALDWRPDAITAEAGWLLPDGHASDRTGRRCWFLAGTLEPGLDLGFGPGQGLLGRPGMRAEWRRVHGEPSRLEAWSLTWQESLVFERIYHAGVGVGAARVRVEDHEDGGREVSTGLRPLLRGFIGARIEAGGYCEVSYQVVSGSVGGLLAGGLGIGAGWRWEF